MPDFSDAPDEPRLSDLTDSVVVAEKGLME